VTVASDGSGNYKTVQEAVNAAASGTVINIKAGTYNEYIHIPKGKNKISLIGAGETTTILKHNLYASMKGSDGQEIGTFATASVFVEGDDFVAESLTFQNTAGQTAGQALAIRVDGDRAIFRKSRFLGWQDTILINKGRQYFTDCYIEGSVDFIFGAATAYFDNCHIHALSNGYLTAASTPQENKYGYVFSHCTVDGASGVFTYLGRPWRPYADVYFIYSSMTNVVRPEGWNNWSDAANEKTARYYEYGNTGAGASTSARVKWSHEITKAEADALTVSHVLGGSDSWNPK